MLEQRIAALELDVAKLRENFAGYGAEHQRILGESEVFEAAIMSLLDLSPDRAALWAALSHRMSKLEARVVAVALTEERLQGVQDAQQLLTAFYGDNP